jgi:hypothetical protein
MRVSKFLSKLTKNVVLMVLNTKRKYLGRSSLSLIFGTRLKLAKFVFFDKNSWIYSNFSKKGLAIWFYATIPFFFSKKKKKNLL